MNLGCILEVELTRLDERLDRKGLYSQKFGLVKMHVLHRQLKHCADKLLWTVLCLLSGF